MCINKKWTALYFSLYVFSVAKIMQHLINAGDNHITKYFIQFKNSLNLFFDNNIYIYICQRPKRSAICQRPKRSAFLMPELLDYPVNAISLTSLAYIPYPLD